MRTSHATTNTAFHNDTTVTRPTWRSFPMSPCRSTCLGACLLVDSACCGSGGVRYSCEVKLACTRDSALAIKEKKKKKEEEEAKGGKRDNRTWINKRMLTLRKLECGEAERLLWTCCTPSVLDLVGGLLCRLLLHWLLDRENLVL